MQLSPHPFRARQRPCRRTCARQASEFEIRDQAASDPEAPAAIVISELGRGFILPAARLALVAESDLTGRRSGAARRRLQARRRQVSGPLDLAESDLVVHGSTGSAGTWG